jgi:hypothetical protein
MSANGSRVSLDATNTNIYNNLITNGNLTTTGVLNIAGYSNVKTALDTLNSGKQDNLTAASTLTIGTLRAGDGTGSVDLVHCEHQWVYSENTTSFSMSANGSRVSLTDATNTNIYNNDHER